MKTIRQLLKVKGNDVWAVEPADSVYEAIEMMAEKGIGALLVMKDSETVGVLSERDYRELIHRSPGYRIVLSAIFVNYVVLMLGFSLDDPELRLLLETHRESLKYRSSPDFLFLPESGANDIQRGRLREDFGVQVISYEPSNGHSEVPELINRLVGELTGENAVDPDLFEDDPDPDEPQPEEAPAEGD